MTPTTVTTHKMVLAMGDERLRTAAADILRRQGISIAQTGHPSDVLRLVRELQPRILLLDLDMTMGDLISTVRVLGRNPQTRGTAVLVTCPERADRTDVRELVAAGAAGVLVRPLRQQTVLDKVLECLARPPRVLESHEHGAHASEKVPGNPSLLRRQLACPYHKQEISFWHYTLRAGKVSMDINFFDIPVYIEAAPGCVYVNYHLLAVAVCPTCHFASNEPEFFLQPGSRRATARASTKVFESAIAAGGETRRQLCVAVSEHFHSERRTLADALTAYELAILCSRELVRCDPKTHAIELVRIGNYHLRCALLLEQSKANERAILSRYEQAAEALKEAYVYVAGPAFYRNAYQLAATLIYLGQDEAAYPYIARLKNLEHTPPSDPAENAALQRYLQSCNKAWEDRDLHRRPA